MTLHADVLLQRNSPVPSFETLPEEVRPALQKIADYDFGFVKQKIIASEGLPPETVDEAIAEFRRFLTLQRLYPGQGFAMVSEIVDEVWHTFILFTREYAAFTEDVFGRFLHHRPSRPEAPTPREFVDNLVTAYETLFGTLPIIWLFNDAAECGGDLCGSDD